MDNNLLEASLSRLQSKLDNYNVGIITAFRGEFTNTENSNRNKDLLAFLLRQKYSVTKVKGTYIENYKSDSEKHVKEESFFVAYVNNSNNLFSDLKKLGILYDQDSIFYKSKENDFAILHGTSKRDNAFPSYGQEKKLTKGTMGKIDSEFFTRINGRPFSFNIVEDIQLSKSINSLYVMNHAARHIDILIKEL